MRSNLLAVTNDQSIVLRYSQSDGKAIGAVSVLPGVWNCESCILAMPTTSTAYASANLS